MYNKRSEMKNNKLSQISNSQKISDIDLKILKDIEKNNFKSKNSNIKKIIF